MVTLNYRFFIYVFPVYVSAGERCLDGETYMKDLFQLNPTAEWVIKVVQR